MRLSNLRLSFLFTGAVLLLLSPALVSTLKADLVWDAEQGWRFEGGVLDSGDPETQRPQNALDLMNQAREFQERGRDRAALRRYRQVTRRYDQSIYAPEALFQRGLIFKERKQWRRAMREFNSIAQEHPEFDKFDELIETQFAIAEKLQDGARTRLVSRVPGFRSKSAAIEYFEDVIRNGPFTEKAPLALMNIAEIELSRNNPEEAIDAFDRLINDYPRSALTPESYFGLAEAFAQMVGGPEYDQGSTRQAIAFYEDFLILFPDHEKVEQAEEGLREMREVLAQSRLVLAEFYHFRRSNYTAARILYNDTITASPDSKAAETARQRLEELPEPS
ncbi:MAG: tetratricopeptide repeat protein [Opitutales bacterium]|nr:tetratricopeptide repeat protein [Opitutales bacterium]MCH8540111.1 tetratricopeptide repeat protein [Opitutales bacterium]